MDPATLTVIRTILAAGAMLVAYGIQQQQQQQKKQQQQLKQESLAAALSPEDELQLLRPLTDDSSVAPSVTPFIVHHPANKGLLSYSFGSVLFAGIELGIFNFLGTSTQAIGVQLTSATHAGFLLQLTAVIVPALAFLGGEQISSQVWAAVALGLLGSCLVAYDSLASDSLAAAGSGLGDMLAASPQEAQGLIFLVGSCVFYSFAVVRLGLYAPRFSPVSLTAVKKTTLALASITWFATTTLSHSAAAGLPSLDSQLEALGVAGKSVGFWALVAYSALGPGAGATYLQTKGQAIVPATQAQVIYSLTPIWGAVMAQLVLGDEQMGPVAWAGGAAVLLASLQAARAQSQGQSGGAAKAAH